MAYIGLALFAEGPTDHRFLQPLLQRAVEDVLAGVGYGIVEVSRVAQLSAPTGQYSSRRDKVAAAAGENQGAFHLLFIHADGAGDPSAARSERVDPASEQVLRDLGEHRRATAPVVPIRETEAWTLADGDALRAVLSTTLDDATLGLPQAPESDLDPKSTLEQVAARARGGRRARRRRSAATFLERLGEEVRLDALRALSAYLSFENDLRDALARLGYAP